MLRDSLTTATERLAAAQVPDAAVDAEILLAHAVGFGRGELAAASFRGESMDAAVATRFEHFVERRASREPLQHITGVAPFRHLELRVGPGVFVPRPETEIVAQFAIDALIAAAEPAPIGIDLGTGSGAIALAMASEVPHAQIFAAENSVDAFVWARENFDRADVAATLAFIDLDRAFPELDGQAAVVISNPPYVPDEAIPRDPEVRLYDPPAALYGGPDGLDVVRTLSRTALRLLRPGGTLVLEHGEWQGAPIRDILTVDGWRAAATHPDLTLRDRATTALRP